MKRVIRLTERDLTNLIKKIVKESMEDSEEMIDIKGDDYVDNFEEEDFDTSEFDDESDYGKMTKEDAINKIAEFLKSDVLPELSPMEKRELKQKVLRSKRPMDLDEDEDLDSRGARRKERAMIGGGLGTAATSAVASLGEFMGYSDFELTRMLHDINEMAGLGRYTGPVTVAMVFAGLLLALKGAADKYSRENP